MIRSYGDALGLRESECVSEWNAERARLVRRNQAHCDASGDVRMYVLMCGEARVRPRTSALHRLRASTENHRV